MDWFHKGNLILSGSCLQPLLSSEGSFFVFSILFSHVLPIYLCYSASKSSITKEMVTENSLSVFELIHNQQQLCKQTSLLVKSTKLLMFIVHFTGECTTLPSGSPRECTTLLP